MDANGRQNISTENPLAAAAFYLISVILFPVTLVGYIIWIGGGLVRGRGSGISITAQGPLSARYLQHRFGTRPDESAERLMRALPNVPPLGLALASWPQIFAHRVTGYVPKTFRYPYEGEVARQDEAVARQSFFDGVLERYLPEITQFVIMGAGFDTRAYELPKGAAVRSFEIDQPETQRVKREILVKAGIDATGVAFVPADFEKEDWFVRLTEAGFRADQPAVFIWEGVTMYLDQVAVKSTLGKIARCAPGTVVAFDHFTSEALTSNEIYWRFARYTTRHAREPLAFGIDSAPPLRERVAEFLASCGLERVEQRTLGQETGGKRAWGGFVVAVAPRVMP